jgi:antibiotic biosynthesis monooxygenase (ABM) superfamily enzyme
MRRDDDMQGKSSAVLLMMIDVKPEDEAGFNRWYNEEHIPELMALPGFISARRFEVEGEGQKYLAIYELEDAKVFDTPQYKAWREASESTRRMSAKFVSRTRRVYRQTFSASAASK